MSTFEAAMEFAVMWHPTGSRYICNPPVTDTDEDFVALATPTMHEALRALGAEVEGSPEEYVGMSDFISYRLGEMNIIACDEKTFFDKFVLATEEAKRRNLLRKEDRIALFQELLYGDSTEQVPL